nr:MAG: transcriptional regulator [Nitrospirota bacterium]
MPKFHLTICDWLEDFWNGKLGLSRTGVLKVFRGGAKSTILAVFQAWVLRRNPEFRFLDRSADDSTACKLSADTQNVLRLHPLCRGLLKKKGRIGVERFHVIGAKDKRNASVTAHGILSNVTSSRADAILNDDPEVPKNIVTTETRQNLRNRLADETHIIVPGGKILYTGTDHTHNSVYDEKIKDGYVHLIIPLFEHCKIFESDGVNATFKFDFAVEDKKDFYVMTGIGRHSRVFEPREYEMTLHRGSKGGEVRLHKPLPEGTRLDVATGNPWPNYFTPAEIKWRREQCKTFNAWDSQYMLKAKPIHEIRLDPERLLVYSEEPEIRFANGQISMMLDKSIQFTGVRACWDCSLGKPDSDDSAFAAMFQDTRGHLYWQILDVMEGEVYDQAKIIVKRVIEYQIPGIIIKTQGVGGFLPAIMKKAFKEAGVHCAVIEKSESRNKNTRILEAYESPLSGQFLHVHRSVYESGLAEQMRDWVPEKSRQPDDLLDAGEGCISSLPVKIGQVVKAPQTSAAAPRHEWRQHSGTYEVRVEA